jgi:hypothetical protein
MNWLDHRAVTNPYLARMPCNEKWKPSHWDVVTCSKVSLMLEIVQGPHSATAIAIGGHDNGMPWVHQCHQVNRRIQQNGSLHQSHGQLGVTLCVFSWRYLRHHSTNECNVR